MKTIYAVNSGCYSDYRVVALFTSKELAEEFMQFVPDDYNTIETFELNPKTSDLIKRGYAPWCVHMLKDGTVENCRKFDMDAYRVTDDRVYVWKRTEAPFYAGRGIPDCLSSSVMAKNEKQAIKITNERRIMTHDMSPL